MRPYTAVLVLPDYMAEDFGHDRYTVWCAGSNVDDAIENAQDTAADEFGIENGTDFYCIALFYGVHENIAPR